MDVLDAAVVDLTYLIATARALRKEAPAAQLMGRRKTRTRLRDELSRAAAAYLAALSRVGDDALDPDALDRCRRAAEREMPRALACQQDLKAMLEQEPGALDAYASARHDLWRISHLAIHLRGGLRMLRRAGLGEDLHGRGSSGRRLQRRIRHGMVAYAGALLRGNAPEQATVLGARRNAIRHLDARCVATAADIVSAASGLANADRLLVHGIAKRLQDLVQDWSDAGSPLPRPT